MTITIRKAEPHEADVVAAILAEAAEWLDQCGMPLWRGEEVAPARISTDVEDGLFFVAERDGRPVGVVKCQLSDELFWPDMPQGNSSFLHRLAVRRSVAGSGVSTALLTWAVQRASALGRHFVRLDCDAARPRLRAVYERFGFRRHSDRQVGPYFVARYELDVRRFRAVANRDENGPIVMSRSPDIRSVEGE